MSKFVEWLNVNKISLNLMKKHYMVFRSCKRTVDSDLKIIMHQMFRCFMDFKLCGQNQLIGGKIFQLVGILYKAQNTLILKH